MKQSEILKLKLDLCMSRIQGTQLSEQVAKLSRALLMSEGQAISAEFEAAIKQEAEEAKKAEAPKTADVIEFPQPTE